MNSIGNNIFINQQAPVVSGIVSNNLNAITAQSMIASQILADKADLIKRAKKIEKSKSIDSGLEHEKQTQEEYHFSTEEYENIFMHENHLSPIPRKEKLKTITKEQISRYQNASENAYLNENNHNILNIKV